MSEEAKAGLDGLAKLLSDDKFQKMMKRAERSEFLQKVSHPITVHKSTVGSFLHEDYQFDKPGKIGYFVAVRPVKDEKTYLGIYLGKLPQQIMATFDPEEKDLLINAHTNPAMFVPELKKIVWGSGSWWTTINKEEDLKQITDADISNTWYVQALKSLEKTDVREKH